MEGKRRRREDQRGRKRGGLKRERGEVGRGKKLPLQEGDGTGRASFHIFIFHSMKNLTKKGNGNSKEILSISGFQASITVDNICGQRSQEWTGQVGAIDRGLATKKEGNK